MFLTVLVVVLVAGLAIGGYAMLAPRRAVPVVAPLAAGPPPHVSASEAERVDTVFAMGALDGDEATRRLAEALDDPSETVALAAAHALATSGRGDVLRAYVDAHPDERTARLTETVDRMHAG